MMSLYFLKCYVTHLTLYMCNSHKNTIEVKGKKQMYLKRVVSLCY